MATVPRLDKDHGFLRFIVQNQIDRDNYDQEQKFLMCKKSRATKKHQERLTYIPPSRRNGCRNDSSGTGPKGIAEKEVSHLQRESPADKQSSLSQKNSCSQDDSNVLFVMEYIPKNSDPIIVTVFNTSSPEQVVEDISDRCQMRDGMKEALYKRILKEIEENKR